MAKMLVERVRLANLTGLPCGRASGRRDVEIGDLSEEEIVAEVDKGVRAVLLKEDAPPPKVL